MAKGRPRLTEDIVRRRIRDYCDRYEVTQRSEAGFPVYPAGKRESRQHREWVVLYKAFSRLRAGGDGPKDAVERATLVRSQKGRCPICVKEVGLDDEIASERGPGDTQVVVHAPCNELLRLVSKLGPSAIERLRGFLWPQQADR